jgi:hypothetical protein
MSCLNEVNNLTNSESLRQGKKFQVQLDKYANIQENFENMGEMDDIYNYKVNYLNANPEPQTSNMQTYLTTYKTDKNNVITNIKNMYNRKSASNNMYLNQNIKFSNGKLFHVTNQGIAKYVPDGMTDLILGKNGCSTTIMDINIPWDDKYLNKGEIIPLDPPLITGTSMRANTICGNEGKNLRAVKMVSDIDEKPFGCYKNDQNPAKMRIIDGVSYIKKNEYTFEDCKRFAIDRSSKYFSLENVDEKTKKGNCALSNDIRGAVKIPNDIGCIGIDNDKKAGLTGMNYIYELPQTGLKSEIGNLFYIDEDSNRFKYPENQMTFGDTFTELKNYDASSSNYSDLRKCTLSLNECLESCKNDINCLAVSSNTSGNILKNKNYSPSLLYPKPGSSVHIKNKIIKENFTGMNQPKPTEVDTYTLSRDIYFNNDEPTKFESVNNLTQNIINNDNTLIAGHETKLKKNNGILSGLSQELITNQDKFFQDNSKLDNNHIFINKFAGARVGITTNIQEENKYLDDYHGIVNDSNIVLLQENRIYIFLCVLLIICLIIFILVINLNNK